MPADLAADTTPVRVAPATYRVELSGDWSFRGPSGGALMTVALRAAALELGDPGLLVRSATTLFAFPVTEGTIEARVEVLRRGNAAAQVRVLLGNAGSGEPGLEVLATFAREREGPAFVDPTPPSVPSPPECPLLHAPTPVRRGFRPPIFGNLEVRLAQGHPWWEEGWPPGPARILRWMRYLKPQLLPDGLLDPLALPPLVDTMPPAATQRLGPGFEPFVAPSLDLTVHFLGRTAREWILLDTRCRFAGSGYGQAEVEVWDDQGRLLAFGTQMWIFRKVPEHFPA